MEIQLREVLATTRRMAEIIAHPQRAARVDEVEHDIDRDYFMTARRGRSAYGLIDDIITPRHVESRRATSKAARRRGRRRAPGRRRAVVRGDFA